MNIQREKISSINIYLKNTDVKYEFQWLQSWQLWRAQMAIIANHKIYLKHTLQSWQLWQTQMAIIASHKIYLKKHTWQTQMTIIASYNFYGTHQ